MEYADARAEERGYVTEMTQVERAGAVLDTALEETFALAHKLEERLHLVLRPPSPLNPVPDDGNVTAAARDATAPLTDHQEARAHRVRGVNRLLADVLDRLEA